MIDLGRARERLRGAGGRALSEPRLLRSLALAEHLRSRLAAGGVNQATLAREHGITRARVTQLLALLRLPEQVRVWIRHEGCREPGLSERRLRPLLALPQARLLALLRTMFPSYDEVARARA